MAVEEPLEHWLAGSAEMLRLLLESISIVCVALGLLIILGQAYRERRHHARSARPFNRIRLTFGSWLSLALEFQLAADIVATTTAPSNENLIKLAVVAVIRTFLNVFLAREVEEERQQEERLLEERRDGLSAEFRNEPSP